MIKTRAQTRRMMKELKRYFESKVEIPLIRHGKKQRLETLINEEALMLAQYIREEKTRARVWSAMMAPEDLTGEIAGGCGAAWSEYGCLIVANFKAKCIYC